MMLQPRCRHELLAREALLSAKYGRRGDVAYRLGMITAEVAPNDGPWTIVPIPPHKNAAFCTFRPVGALLACQGPQKTHGLPDCFRPQLATSYGAAD